MDASYRPVFGTVPRPVDRDDSRPPWQPQYIVLFHPVTVYCIKGERDLVPAIEAIATDLLRLLKREEATHPQARGTIRSILNQIARSLDETIVAVASSLTDTFGASVVDEIRPHSTETILFRRYVLEDDLANFMRRLSLMLATEACERVADKATATTHAR